MTARRPRSRDGCCARSTGCRSRRCTSRGTSYRRPGRRSVRTPAAGHPAIVVAHGFTGRSGPARTYGARRERLRAVRGPWSPSPSGATAAPADAPRSATARSSIWPRRWPGRVSSGTRRVVTVGFSMGGSVVLRHAALYRDRASGHGPGAHSARGGARSAADASSGERAGPLVLPGHGPHAAAALGGHPARGARWSAAYGLRTRIHHRTGTRCRSPRSSRSRYRPDPAADRARRPGRLLPAGPPAHAGRRGGEGGAELWLEPGMGHAENAADDALLARIGDWAAAHAG